MECGDSSPLFFMRSIAKSLRILLRYRQLKESHDKSQHSKEQIHNLSAKVAFRLRSGSIASPVVSAVGSHKECGIRFAMYSTKQRSCTNCPMVVVRSTKERDLSRSQSGQ